MFTRNRSPQPRRAGVDRTSALARLAPKRQPTLQRMGSSLRRVMSSSRLDVSALSEMMKAYIPTDKQREGMAVGALHVACVAAQAGQEGGLVETAPCSPRILDRTWRCGHR